ncbi:hypothetical protein [Arthrobacter sp. AETb3-4]|uniref:MHS family MFS transporter n=1 Tax=Arthrobacter wenxiniae TaxID=2713570 RepID=A0A7Y7IFZ6_9MICC|nr:MHS family MFS transporter [Arthrobacter wenxiniae]
MRSSSADHWPSPLWPPAFVEARKNGQIATLPAAVLLTRHWHYVVGVIHCAFIAAVNTVLGALAIKSARYVAHVNNTITLWLVVAANFVALFTESLSVKLADPLGRRPVLIQAVASAVLTPLFLPSLDSGSGPLMVLESVVCLACGHAAANAVWPSFHGEAFSTTVHFSGPATGTRIVLLTAGFAPATVTAMGGIQPGPGGTGHPMQGSGDLAAARVAEAVFS